MDDLVTIQVVPTEIEAGLVSGILRDAGIKSISRPTNFAVGAADAFYSAGPHEIVVRAEDVDQARRVLDERRPV